MADLHDLSPTPGSTRERKRLGRGPGSGKGKTSGKGHKGHKARTGGKTNPGFEGGQMPLMRRIPKRGFTSRNRVEYQIVNVRDLERFDGDVNAETLATAGLIGSSGKPVKVLGEGDLTKALTVTADAFSGAAREKIQSAGGTATLSADAEAGS